MGAAAEASRSGDLLNDTYELCELLESGVVHQAYRARDTRDDRVVRIALLRPELALRAGVAQRFVKGATAFTQIDHPNVARVLSVETDVSGIPFVVEEVIEGESLAKMLGGFPDGMPLGVVMNLLVPVSEAIAAAHERGLAHGALDAEHILLASISGTSVPKVLGFSSGTDLRADVHALGALFYRALSGQLIEHDRKHVPLDELVPHVPSELTELVESCLGAEHARPRDARPLCAALTALRQRLGGARSSAIGAGTGSFRTLEPTAKVVARPPAKAAQPVVDSRAMAKPPAKPLATAKPVVAIAESPPSRRKAMERAVTAPLPDSGPVMEYSPATAIDALAQTAVDASDPSELDPFAVPARPSMPAPTVPSFPEMEAPQIAPEKARAPGAFHADAHAATHFATPAAVVDAAALDPFAFPMANSGAAPPPLPSSKGEMKAAVARPPRLASPAAPPAAAPQKEVSAKAETQAEHKNGRAPKPRPETEKMAGAGTAGLAAAFGPLDGAAAIEQGETHSGELGRAFRESMETEKSGRKNARGALAANNAAESSAATAGGPPALKSKAERDAASLKKSAAEALALSQLQAVAERRSEQRKDFVGTLLMLLFAFGLLRAVPLLSEPDPEVARELLGDRLTISAVAFASLSVIVMIQTWAMQIRTKTMVLRPVTMTLKVVTVCVCVLTGSLFMPSGALGMFEGVARRGLPWGSAFFFLFLGLYGVVRGVQGARSNMLIGAATTILFAGSFVASFQVVNGVIVPGLRRSSQAEVTADVRQKLLGAHHEDENPVIDAGTVEQAQEGFRETHLVGASEEEDMKSIRAMGQARKHNSKSMENLNDKIPDLVK